MDKEIILDKPVIGYKFIQSDMKSQAGGTKWRRNSWKKHKGELKLCISGFHACRTALQSLEYTYGDRWFIVEAKGKFFEEKNDKFVASEMRLTRELPTKKIVVEFAVKCAKRYLKNFEKEYPDDKRPKQAINAAMAWLKNPCKQTEEAAWSAGSAAWSAAWSAGSAAWSAAWSAGSAARSAAWSAAESAEVRWQTKCLDKIIKIYLDKGE